MEQCSPFIIPFKSKHLHGDTYCGRYTSPIFCIHGAGKSSRIRFSETRAALQAHGIASVAFDCVGHGDSGGNVTESSLASRTEQAETVIEAQNLASPLILLGTSMGAYNAVMLTKTRKVSALILIVPAVYTSQAYEIPFGPEFSQIIRQERSWENTDAWETLATFQGKLLVIAAEDDSVIPHEIPERIFNSAISVARRKLIWGRPQI